MAPASESPNAAPSHVDADAAVEVGGRTRLVGRRWSGQYSDIGAAFVIEHPPPTG